MFDSFNPKKNSAFWINWALVIFALIIIWKYRASGAFWMGVLAIYLIGIRVVYIKPDTSAETAPLVNSIPTA